MPKKLDKPPRIDIGCQNVPVLSVSPAQNDHITLERLLPGPQWRVYRADAVMSALALLRTLRRVPVVVCERDLLPGTWHDLLVRTALLPEPPSIIVASRLADDYLWAEVLNLGAYNVLVKPFDVVELTHSLSLAWLRGQHERGVSDRLPRVVAAGVA